jgi:uncharacterized protein HemX
MSALILLIALILALAAGYLFLQWKCPSKKDKMQQLVENVELEEEIDFNDLETLTPNQIKEVKSKLGEETKKLKELQKKKTDELTEEESKDLANLPTLQEIQALAQDIQKVEDLGKKVYGTMDYVYAGGISLGVFFISAWLFGKFFGIVKMSEEK